MLQYIIRKYFHTENHLLEACVKLTIVLVTLVPMFAPMIIGIAVLTGTSVATRPTMMVVDVELDWTNTVTSTPIINPTTGLFNSSELPKKARKIFNLNLITISFSAKL